MKLRIYVVLKMGNPNCFFMIIAGTFFPLQPIAEGNCVVHTVLVLYTGSMTYELLLCCPSFLCLMLLAMSCNVLNMYRIDFLGEATLFFEIFHCPCIIVLGFLYFVYGEKLWKIHRF